MKHKILDALRRNNALLRELSIQYGAATGDSPFPRDPSVVRTPADVDALLRAEMAPLKQEQLRVILLNTKQEIVGIENDLPGHRQQRLGAHRRDTAARGSGELSQLHRCTQSPVRRPDAEPRGHPNHRAPAQGG